MELADALAFARSTTQGILTTLRRDGRPQLSNIAYWLDDEGVFRISVTDGRAKTANLRRDPRASLYIGRDDFWAYVVLDATAELLPVTTSPDDLTADRMVDYYRALRGEHPDWDDYRRAMVADRRLLVELRPTSCYGMLNRP